MDKDSVTLNFKQIGAIIAVLLNLIIIGPGGWILKTLWSDTVEFRKETDNQIHSLKKQIGEVKVDLSSKYVSKKVFSQYKENMAENIRYLDSKVGHTKNH